MSRANYKVPRWVKKRMENELYQYWDNKKELEEMQNNILDESPNPPDGLPRGNKTSNPTEQKEIKDVIKGYTYFCPECYEDFYSFEQ